MSRQACRAIAYGSAVLGAVALLTCAGQASATVTWSFTEKTLTYALSGAPVAGFVAGAVGFLSVSDEDFLKGGISYSFTQDSPDGATASGDTDFSFLASTQLFLPREVPDSLIGDRDAAINLSFDRAGGITGLVTEDLALAGLQMVIAGNEVASGAGSVGTDDTDLQCPDTQCNLTGFWTLLTALPMPEPGSTMLLAMALALTGWLRRARPKRS